MKCKRPLLYYDDKIWGYNPKIATLDSVIILGCGKCLSCRINHSKEWAVKCDLESKRWKHNYFITLTYSDEHVPKNEHGIQVLQKSDVQKMIKRIRKYFDKHNLGKLKYLYCGEYGPRTYRPHYHMILFSNYEIPDLKYHSKNDIGDLFYISDLWTKWWPYGYHLISGVGPNAGAYVARYTVKKNISKFKDKDGQLDLPKEFINFSNKDGGLGWNEFLKKDYWKSSGQLHYAVNMKNDIQIKSVNIPKYWIKKLEYIIPEYEHSYLKEMRVNAGKQRLREHLQHLTAKEEICKNYIEAYYEDNETLKKYLKKKI